MASIQISNLCPAGSDLFKDSESFMTELVNNELGTINGGIGATRNSPWCGPTIRNLRCKPLFPRPHPSYSTAKDVDTTQADKLP